MPSWKDVEQQAPELARAVRDRFEAYGLGLLATIRRDGAPRICGIEPLFARDELWLGMMPDSRKSLDLQRDGRFALHSATTDKQVTAGDARISGLGILVEAASELTAFRDAFAAQTGAPPPDGPFDLFRADVREVSMIKPGGDHLDIELWRAGQPARHIERR